MTARPTAALLIAVIGIGCAQSTDDLGGDPTPTEVVYGGDTGTIADTVPSIETPEEVSGPHGGQALNEATGIVHGAGAYEGAGAAIVWLDADGDGDDDLVALADQSTDPGAGPPYIAVWDTLPTGSNTFLDSAWTVNNDLGTDESRIRWMGEGDLSGDGLVDLLVERTLPDGGAETVLLAGPLGSVRSLGGSDAQVVFERDALALRWQTIPDVTGDGIDDLLAGDPEYQGDAIDSGQAWVFAGPLVGRREEDLAFATLQGALVRDALGAAMAANDVNGDGIGDVALAASTEHVYILQGPLAGPQVVQTSYSARWTYDPLEIEPTSVYTSPVWVGDATGDGHADMLFGSQELRLVEGPLLGELDEGDVLATFPGATDFSVGDANADGVLDVLVGNEAFNGGVSADEGVAFLYYGPMAGGMAASDAEFSATLARDRLGAAVALGDGDGDGFDDIAIGVPGLDAYGVEAGAILIFRGGV